MLLSPASTNATLKSNATIWSRIKKKVDWDAAAPSGPPMGMPGMPMPQHMGMGMPQHMGMGGMGGQPQNQVMRQRFLTLVYGDMETIKILPNTYAEAEALAREWVQPPPSANFHLRVPVEYASLQASRLIQGPWLWISSEEAYQIAIAGLQGLRVEIVSDAPPPPDEPPPPPPPPVLEMPATFNLELNPGQLIAIDTTISSDDLDLSRTEDGTVVAGTFFGKLHIVHDGDTHTMEFSGARKDDIPPDLFVDSRVLTKLATTKPTTAHCNIYMYSPDVQYSDVYLGFSPFWKMGATWPPAETVNDNKVKFFVRVHQGGAMEYILNQTVVTSLYYEAMPDTSTVDPSTYIAPYNGFAMPTTDFIPHLTRVLDALGLSLQTRTNFISNNIVNFLQHPNIAYRFMSPARLTAAMDLSVSIEDDVAWTRLFLLFKGVSDDELEHYVGAGEKEASQFNWKDIVGWDERCKRSDIVRVFETGIMDCT